MKSKINFIEMYATQELEPKVFIVCQSAFEMGIIHGVWVDLLQTKSVIQSNIDTMLTMSPTGGIKGWKIQEYDGFGYLGVDEHEPLERLLETVNFLIERGELGSLVLEHTDSIESAKFMLDSLYQGAYFDKKDFAKTVYECELEFNPALSFYLNIDALAEDLFRFDYSALDDGKLCHVFSR